MAEESKISIESYPENRNAGNHNARMALIKHIIKAFKQGGSSDDVKAIKAAIKGLSSESFNALAKDLDKYSNYNSKGTHGLRQFVLGEQQRRKIEQQPIQKRKIATQPMSFSAGASNRTLAQSLNLAGIHNINGLLEKRSSGKFSVLDALCVNKNFVGLKTGSLQRISKTLTDLGLTGEDVHSNLRALGDNARLVSCLTKYKERQEKGQEFSRGGNRLSSKLKELFGAASKIDKLKAVESALECMVRGKAIPEEHAVFLNQGTLGEIIKNHFQAKDGESSYLDPTERLNVEFSHQRPNVGPGLSGDAS